jgi:hypothetical protein
VCVLQPLRTNGFFQFPFAAMHVKGGMKYLRAVFNLLLLEVPHMFGFFFR